MSENESKSAVETIYPYLRELSDGFKLSGTFINYRTQDVFIRAVAERTGFRKYKTSTRKLEIRRRGVSGIDYETVLKTSRSIRDIGVSEADHRKAAKNILKVCKRYSEDVASALDFVDQQKAKRSAESDAYNEKVKIFHDTYRSLHGGDLPPGFRYDASKDEFSFVASTKDPKKAGRLAHEIALFIERISKKNSEEK